MPPAIVLALVGYLRYEIDGRSILETQPQLDTRLPLCFLWSRAVQIQVERQLPVGRLPLLAIIIRHHGIGLQTAWQIPRITPAQLEVFGSYEFLLLLISVGIAPSSPHHLLIAGYISTLHRLLQADVSWQVLHKLLSATLFEHRLLRL